MRQARLKAPADHPVSYYHCISRVVDRRFVLGDLEKEQFVAWMRHYEAFCGVRVVTFCILSNHVHILLEVPQRPAVLPSDEELLVMLERSYSKGFAQTIRQRLETLPEDERQVLNAPRTLAAPRRHVGCGMKGQPSCRRGPANHEHKGTGQ